MPLVLLLLFLAKQHGAVVSTSSSIRTQLILARQLLHRMSELKRLRPESITDEVASKRNRVENTSNSNSGSVAGNVAGNRRMFGALMGHLGQAQKKLNDDSEVIKMQVSRRQEVSQKNSEESKRAAKLQRTLSVEQKEKVNIKL